MGKWRLIAKSNVNSVISRGAFLRLNEKVRLRSSLSMARHAELVQDGICRCSIAIATAILTASISSACNIVSWPLPSRRSSLAATRLQAVQVDGCRSGVLSQFYES